MNRRIALLAALALASSSALAGCGDSPADGTPADAATDVDAADSGSGFDGGTDAAVDGGADAVDDATDGGGDAGTDDGSPDAEADTAEVGDDSFFDPDLGQDGGTGGPDGGDLGPIEILAIDPARGPVEGGTAIVVFGSGFSASTELLINGRRVEDFDLVDEETLLARTPANPAGTWDVKAIGESGDYVLEDGFTYFEALSLTSIEPARGPVRGGVPVTLTGTGFTPDASVSVDGRLAIDVHVIDGDTIEFVMPPGDAGTADVRLTSANGSRVLDDAFEYYEDVDLAAVVPSAGNRTGTYTVQLSGTGFGPDCTVFFGGREAVTEYIDPTTLEVAVPAGPAGFVDVRVDAVDRLGDTLLDGFFYIDNSVEGLSVQAVVPGSGSAAGGQTVVVAGTGLDAATEVRFGASEAEIVTAGTTRLVVNTPPGSVGSVDVTVVTPDDTQTLADGFEYVPELSIRDVDPSAGSIVGGLAVTVTGEGFDAATSVRFGAVGARSVSLVSPTELAVVTPPNTVGLTDVTVSRGGQIDVLEDGYRYTTVADVTAMAPTRGAIAGNTWVVIRGSGFDADSTAFFDGIEVPEVTLIDPSTLAVRTPPHDAATVSVDVEVGGELLRVPGRFVYYDPFSDALGWWGEAIDGSVNVTVLDGETGARIAEAYITLGYRASDTIYTGVTNANGQVTISYPEISGPQTVSATASGYSSVTVTNVDAENVIVVLTPFPPPPSDGEPPPPPDWPIVTGTLTGLDKIVDPGPNERLIAVIRNTTTSPGGSNPQGTGYTEVEYTDGETAFPYSMPVRPGDMAVVAICGVFNDVTGEFTPLYMGVERRLFTRMGEDLIVDLDCDISMDATADFKFVNAPRGPGGPDVNVAIPYLDFGGEGGIDLLYAPQADAEIVSGTRLVDLAEPALEGAVYYMVGQAVPTDANLPFSVAFARDVTDLDELVIFGPMVSPANLVYPAAPGFNLVERRLEWSISGTVAPDFYYAYIMDGAQEVMYWEIWLPGDEAGINLPAFPDDAPGGGLPNPMILIVLAVDAITFNYDEFEFNDFGLDNWASYSANGWVLFP